MQSVTYSVPSINCHHCIHTIKTELSEIAGVNSVDADSTTKQVVVLFEAPATALAIEELLSEINYPVQKNE